MESTIPIHTGRIEKGKIMFDNEPRFLEWIGKLYGNNVEVIVRKKQKPKTNPMRRYYFGVLIKIISEETGHHPLEVHEFCKANFLPPQHKSTNDLSTVEEMNYWETIRSHFAQEFQFFIPLPNEVEYGEPN